MSSAREHAADVDSSLVVDVIAITTIIATRIFARGARSDAYEQSNRVQYLKASVPIPLSCRIERHFDESLEVFDPELSP